MPAPPAERLRRLFVDAVRAVSPRALVAARLRALDLDGTVDVLALGKAAVGMAAGALDAAGDRVVGGVVVAPAPAPDLAPLTSLVGAHPWPDARSLAAGRALLSHAAGCAADHLLVLVSGGASSLACVPAPGLAFADKRAAVAAVMAGGAPIAAINCVRKHLSAIKGGQLAAAAAAPVTALVISDVVGDDLGVIGSGPTVPDASSPAEAIAVLDAYAGADAAAARRFLAARSERSLARRAGDRVLLLAPLSAVADYLGEHHDARVVDRALAGDVAAVADRVIAWADDPGPELIVAAGEATVALPPSPGIGGRATQLALLVARRLAGRPGITVLVAGTDGVDGASHAAGAVVDGDTWDRVADGDRALRRCDAAPALEAAGALVVTGPTGVNHADLIAILRH